MGEWKERQSAPYSPTCSQSSSRRCTLDASAPGLESGRGVSCSVIILPEQGQDRRAYPLVFHECMHHSTEAHHGHVRNPKKYNIGAEEQVINLLF